MKNLSMKEEEFYEVEYNLKTHLSHKSKHNDVKKFTIKDKHFLKQNPLSLCVEFGKFLN